MTDAKTLWKGNLLAAGANAKTRKGDGSEFVTAIMYLQPFTKSGLMNSCAMAEMAGCVKACLNTAGRGIMDSVQTGRQRKTEWFATDRNGFMAQLVRDLGSFSRWAEKRGIKACVRLNGTSDIRWELIKVSRNGQEFPHIFAAFPDVQFYDYTKIANRRIEGIPNYSLTWSYSGANPAYAAMAETAKAKGMNIAVVFRSKEIIPVEFLGWPTIDGDRDDLRFLDPRNSIVALYAKGQAKKDQSGFVVGAGEVA